MKRLAAIGMAAVLAGGSAGFADTVPVTTGLLFDLSAKAGTLNAGGNAAAMGEDVNTWVDQSGNGINFSPTSAARRPTLTTTAGGAAGLYFDGANDILKASHALTTDIRTIVFTFTPTSTLTYATPAQVLLSVNTPDANGNAPSSSNGYREAIELGSTTGNYPNEIITTRSRVSDDHIFPPMTAWNSSTGSISGLSTLTVVLNGSGIFDLYLNGVNVRNANINTDDTGFELRNEDLYLGARFNFNGFFSGYLHEVTAYTTSLDDADRQSVESYMVSQFTAAAVPEPTGLLVLGLGSVAGLFRRSR